MRPGWHEYFLKIALDVSARATCIRRRYGAVVVDRNNVIISTGYCGAARGVDNCCDHGQCERQRLGVPSGERYELCVSVHAEANAIISGDPKRMEGGTIYINGEQAENGKQCNSSPCVMCERMIRNAGLARIVYVSDDGQIQETWLKGKVV
jgi:dCMP deaminase